MNKAAEAIWKIAKKGKDARHCVCIVDSISGSKCDVTPVSGEAPMKKVRLNADINSDLGIVITPKNNSVVLVCVLGPADAFVCMYSEIEKITMKIGNSSVLIKDGEISFNGGNNKGLVVLDDIVKRYNKIENDINSLKQVLSAWTPVANDGGAALKGASASWFSQQLITTTASMIENTKVKH